MKISERVCKTTALCFAVIMSVFGAVSTCGKITKLTAGSSSVIAAAGEAKPRSSAATDIERNKSSKKTASSAVTGSDKNAAAFTDTDTYTDILAQSRDSGGYSEEDHTSEETYLVTESLYRESNMSYDNFFVKNATDISLDLRGYLAARLPFSYEETDEPQVLIVHTHSTEAYMDSDLGYYYESYDPSDTDDTKNV